MKWLLSLLLLVTGSVRGVDTDTIPPIILDLGEESPRKVQLFGGGYRADWRQSLCLEADVDSDVDASANAVYLVDTASGAVIWSALGPGAGSTGDEGAVTFGQSRMTHSIVAPVASVDSDGNGLVDRAYVADTGGTLWRLSFPEAGPGSRGGVEDVLGAFTATPLAVLGGEGAAGRRFFHQVDYVQSRDELGDYDGIFLVSGDRATPEGTEVENYAYLVKDRGGPTVTHEQLAEITLACIRRDDVDCRNLDLSRGWKLALQALGEKGLSRPLVSRGVVYFSTYTPAPAREGSCEEPAAGPGQVYAVELSDGAPAVSRLVLSETGSPAEVEGSQERSFELGPGIPGPAVPWRGDILLPGTGDEGIEFTNAGGLLRWRIYWREEGVDIQ